MKKSLLLICFFAYLLNAQSQTLYGLTNRGGKDDGGALIKFEPATNSLTVCKSFENYAGHPYYTKFIQASDGKLYGMTSDGGAESFGVGDGYGVIFSFDPSSATYTMLKAFDNTNGRNPYGSLVQASDGKLYGMTIGGGSSDYGVIFSFDLPSSTYTRLVDFDYTNGGQPNGSLVQANDGKLYGMTSGGGSNGFGVIFSFDPSSSTYTKLMDFDGTNGRNPSGSLMQASDGKLYGMTIGGGSGDYGIIFSFDPISFTYTKLKDFGGANGSSPFGSLMQAGNGKLYGMTGAGGNSFGYGVIFSFDPSTSTYTKLKDFDYTNGYDPTGDLVQASDGKLYGMTRGGGTHATEGGVIFSFDPFTSAYTKLVDLDRAKGSEPFGSLVQANNGKLYGMTYHGGGIALEYNSDGSGRGVIFSFDPSNSTYTKLKNLDGNDGGRPTGALLKAGNGQLYGMTTRGGSNAAGAIFSFDPSTSVYKKLFDFDGSNGAHPFGSLIQATDGKLYGMTSSGGIESWGVIFSFDPTTSTFTKLKDIFGSGSGVVNPYGTLLQASDGKLYGMGGDKYGTGNTIFSFDLSSSTFNILVGEYYYPINGSNPCNKLIQASNGKLYGMMRTEGSGGGGVIFSFDPLSSTYTKLKDFDNTGIDGSTPDGWLFQASNGKLYGSTIDGGSGDYGVIFSFDPLSSTYTKLKDFDYVNGGYPDGGLMQASDGKLYGMTSVGGSNGVGAIFSFDPSSSTYARLKDLDGTSATYTHFGSAFIEVNDLIPAVSIAITSGTNPNCTGTNVTFTATPTNGGNTPVYQWKLNGTNVGTNSNTYQDAALANGAKITCVMISSLAGANPTTAISNEITMARALLGSCLTIRYPNTKKSFVKTYHLSHANTEGKNQNKPAEGVIQFTPKVVSSAIPELQVQPNPANQNTTITFYLEASARISIDAFNMAGQHFGIIENKVLSNGNQTIPWNTEKFAAGVYFVRLRTDNYSIAKKVIVIH